MTDQPTAADQFFSQAVPRMLRVLIVLDVLFALAVILRFGKIVALGFAIGALFGYLGLRSLHRAVDALTRRIADGKSPEHAFLTANRFFLRYLFAGAVAYVIFTSSQQAFRGFLFGLCTPVAALLCEAAFEAYAALRRGY